MFSLSSAMFARQLLVFATLVALSSQAWVQVAKGGGLKSRAGGFGESEEGGARTVTKDEFPFMTRLTNSRGDKFGGAVVSQGVVLTTASHVQGLDPVTVQLLSGELYTSWEVVVHEKYQPGDLDHNIALVKYNSTAIVTEDDCVNCTATVRLPTILETRAGENIFAYLRVDELQWVDSTGDGQERRAVECLVILNKECDFLANQEGKKDLLCTSKTSKTQECQVGAPLTVMELDDIRTMVGMLVGCPVTSHPVYLRLSEFTKWIEKRGGPLQIFC